ncbi:hypothetical protein L208DRAFT_1550107 [Tricholoma matsutake]|nr:hypothetical protein L208DRAFT_1550107 [Tricholoma matsutake 945]
MIRLSVMPDDHLRISTADSQPIWVRASQALSPPSSYSIPAASNPLLSPLSVNTIPETLYDNQLEPAFDDTTDFGNLKGILSLTLPCPRRKHYTKIEAVHTILTILRDARMPPSEFLTLVLDDSTNDFATYRTAFFTDAHSSKLRSLLELIWNNKKGCSHMKEWMKPHAVDLVCDIIDDEMDSARPKLSMTTQEITPEFISQWDINGLMDQINSDTTPVWTRVLEAASETKEDKAKLKTSKSRNRHTVTSYIHYLRSYHSCKVQIGLGLMAWSTGASRQLINVLNQGCLSMSYTSIFSIIQALAKRALEDARVIAAGPHGLQYDNYNQSTSIHPEQGPNAPNKVQSGTVGVLFEVLSQ